MHGSGFGPGETITVKLAGDEVASSTSDNTGAFDTTFVISSAYAGRGRTELTVSAQGETGPPQSSVRELGRVVRVADVDGCNLGPPPFVFTETVVGDEREAGGNARREQFR